MQKEVNYYWYHHMIPTSERKIISDTINNHDFEKFIELYKKYTIRAINNGQMIYIDNDKNNNSNIIFCPMTFLPNEASIYNKETNTIEYIDILNKNNFMKITYEECECG